ncbi:MFS transporter [Salinarimonas soli]|uniref:MFS transporter n=1 Tax=Salinarimonas soli TaxID=1638099 RepID=A0A5B2VDP3_9HYPH|nr:MFS transporter [Salinarimonas soli]KAA2236227.1 MFS transporter [Salinarimonas soli]
MSRRPLGSSTRVVVAALAATQLIGWGSTYYLPAVLLVPLGRDLGLSRELVIAGVTVMLLAGAVAAPRAGLFMDRRGVRGLLAVGSGLMALALVTLASSTSWVGYAAAWTFAGLAMPLALSQGALAVLARVAGADARRAFATMLLMSGFSSTLFWPLTAALDAAIGWRATCLAYAGVHFAVCLPLHLFVTSRRLERPPEGVGDVPVPEPVTGLDPARQRVAFWWCALAFSVQGFVSWGLPLNIVEILKAFDHPTATAVAVGSLIGPAQVAARLGETLFGQQVGILRVGLASALLAPFAVALPLAAGASLPVVAAFVIGYGLSAGAFTIVRAVVPLALFGRERYATMTGRLAVPQNIAFAAAPVAFASVLDAWGAAGTLWLAVGGALVALASLVALSLAVRV